MRNEPSGMFDEVARRCSYWSMWTPLVHRAGLACRLVERAPIAELAAWFVVGRAPS